MRRSKRLCAADVARQLGVDIDSENSSDTSSEPTSESEEEDMNSYLNLTTTTAATEMDWRFVQSNEDHHVPLEDFTALCSGIQSDDVPVSANENVQFFLDLFLTEELFDNLIYWTNKRAEKYMESEDTEPNAQLSHMLARWHPVSKNELRKFFGILLCMRLNQKPEIRQYWSRNILYKSDFFQDSKCLPRNRFEEISKYLRFCDYDHLSDSDKLSKIRPFLEMVKRLCKSVYIPKNRVSVDESLLLYKGRLGMRRYIPSKRARYGILSYCLCESDTGYTWNIFVAAGKNENDALTQCLPSEAQSFTFSEKIVVALLDSLLGSGFHVFFDNFFGSVRLAHYLFQNKTLVTGTIRHFRGVPEMLKERVVRAKSQAFCRKDEILCVKVVDKKTSGLKTVYLIDTAHSAQTETRNRILRGGIQDTVEKCTSVLQYNRAMGGVDMRDGSLHPYCMARKSFKWFTKLGVHLMQVMIRNSWIVFRSCGGDFDFLTFQEKVIELLVMGTGEGRRGGSRGGRVLSQNNNNAMSLHIPTRLPPTQKKSRPAKRCRVCWGRGQRKETVFICSACPTNPGLCVDECFREFHISMSAE